MSAGIPQVNTLGRSQKVFILLLLMTQPEGITLGAGSGEGVLLLNYALSGIFQHSRMC